MSFELVYLEDSEAHESWLSLVIISCTPNPLHCGGTGGCMGAVPQLAFTYASLFGVVGWLCPKLSLF